ncbi:MAG: aldo/keto reductase [Candidatus Anammoximicrobium sp.]|nr:aldo/keto reductase [Candidatus Anammoximicrobium sp.]
MKYRVLGKTGGKISEVGLGTWQLGGADWGRIAEADALRVLHRAAESGVTFFDTADVYGMGVSERTIGKFLKETKEKVCVATKVGRKLWAESGLKWPERITLEMARQATESSLRNLGVDVIFLQQWHCLPTEEYRRGEVFEHLETLRREGLIQHWGCSVESVEEARLCMTHPGCATLQVIFNIFRQKLIDDLLPQARQHDVGILARVPLASGLLTGRFGPGHQFPPTDHRAYNADGQVFNVGETFAGIPFQRGVELAERVRAILEPDSHETMAQLALRWILDYDAVSSVIPGASTVEQAGNNAAAAGLLPLGEATHRQLRELYEAEVAPLIRGPY